MIGHKTTASNCPREGLVKISGNISSQKEWLGFGTGCPGRWQSPHPWRYLRRVAVH